MAVIDPVIIQDLKKNIPILKKQFNPIPREMNAMVMGIAGRPLIFETLAVPVPSAKQVLIKIIACGVCRTDLHIMDNELPQPKLPLIPGHEIIGIVADVGKEAFTLKRGDLVGVAWLGFTCGHCKYCLKNEENLCENALFTGYTIDGGYAEYTVAYEEYCFPLAPMYGNASGAPLLCAGLIGYRCYNMIGNDATRLGIYGFGAAAHILMQVARYQGKEIYAFTGPGDVEAQKFALSMGATWAGDSTMNPPGLLDAAIIFAPIGGLIPKALADVDKGGRVICGGIHMSDIPSFPYDILWGERTVSSIANLTRKDGREFLELASKVPVNTKTRLFKLNEANEALTALRNGEIHGAAVLVM
jgi:propanol-preferring alcohol dehydrogenase